MWIWIKIQQENERSPHSSSQNQNKTSNNKCKNVEKGNPVPLLMGMSMATAALENSLGVPPKVRIYFSVHPKKTKVLTRKYPHAHCSFAKTLKV